MEERQEVEFSGREISQEEVDQVACRRLLALEPAHRRELLVDVIIGGEAVVLAHSPACSFCLLSLRVT